MSNILNGKVQSNGLGYVKANIDGVLFNKISTKSKTSLTNLPVMPISNSNLWKNNNEDMTYWSGINAVDINWNDAQVEDNIIIHTTGELLSWIKSKLNGINYEQYNILLNKINNLETIINNMNNMEEKEKYYLGTATEEQITNQSYINSLTCNIDDKPTELNFARGFNVLIVPNTWGNPIIIDSAGFRFSSYELNELGIENPEGKLVYVYECNSSNITVRIQSWEI